jgi:hypothetical protein
MSKSKIEIETVELSKKHAPHFVKKRKCKVPECERPVMASEARNSRYLCSIHNNERLWKNRPVLVSMCANRRHAKMRNIPYNVSRRHYYYLNFFTLYWKKKGRKPDALTIDRIDNSKGYTDDNIQVVDKRYNCQKRQGKDLWEE